jgi:predicted TPR repeat methyltransferase
MLETERTATGRIPPGHSGNPAGRPPGSRNKSTLAVEDALAARAEEAVDALVRSACEGNGAALRICFDRLAPPAKWRRVPFALPPLGCRDDVVAAGAAIVMGMADGDLTPAQAQEMLKVLQAFAKLLPSPPKPGRAAAPRRQPREPAEACISPQSEAQPGHHNSGGLDPVPISSATPDPPPTVPAAAGRLPPAPAETCRSLDVGHAIVPKPAEPGGALATGRRKRNPDTPPDRPPPARSPLFASSGDPVADGRYDLARQCEEAGDPTAAAELLLQAVEIAPNFASAWFALGELREKTSDRPGAIAAFRKALLADRGDRHGAGLRLVRLGEAVAGEPMSQGYVRALFDHHAPRFDAELVANHAYRGPKLLRQAVETVAGTGARFERMLDLGCGTGFAAAAFAPMFRTAVGIDLSPAMIEIARRKGRYVDLAVADMTERLAQEPSSSADLVVAADVFTYLADLMPVCRQAARVLMPGGLFAFSVETHPGGGVILGEKLRYAHAIGDISAALDAASLGIRVCDPAAIRHEGGTAVPGFIVVASPARPPPVWAARGVPRGRG